MFEKISEFFYCFIWKYDFFDISLHKEKNINKKNQKHYDTTDTHYGK